MIMIWLNRYFLSFFVFILFSFPFFPSSFGAMTNKGVKKISQDTEIFEGRCAKIIGKLARSFAGC